MGTSSGAYELNHECDSTHQNEYTYFISAIKHGYKCFITSPTCCASFLGDSVC